MRDTNIKGTRGQEHTLQLNSHTQIDNSTRILNSNSKHTLEDNSAKQQIVMCSSKFANGETMYYRAR